MGRQQQRKWRRRLWRYIDGDEVTSAMTWNRFHRHPRFQRLQLRMRDKANGIWRRIVAVEQEW